MAKKLSVIFLILLRAFDAIVHGSGFFHPWHGCVLWFFPISSFLYIFLLFGQVGPLVNSAHDLMFGRGALHDHCVEQG